MQTLDVIDSHTAGEPTRVVTAGFPDLGGGDPAARLKRFRQDFDHWRSAIVCEPRGSDTVVGALLLPPTEPDVAAGVIFFNNVGYLGMCGHGTIARADPARDGPAGTGPASAADPGGHGRHRTARRWPRVGGQRGELPARSGGGRWTCPGMAA